LRILEFLEKVIDEVDPDRGRVCDLFAGTGAVARRLSYSRPVTAVDIQEYSKVICSAILNPEIDLTFVKQHIAKCQSSDYTTQLLKAVQPLVDYEEKCLKWAIEGQPEPLCDLLEHGSLVKSILEEGPSGRNVLNNAINEVLKSLAALGMSSGPKAMILRHAGGIYFSYKQAALLDCIREEIENTHGDLTNTCLAALISTASETVNTVGKQFAQPIRPRKASGEPKPSIGKQAGKDRSLDIWKEYEKWLYKYMGATKSPFEHRVIKDDYIDALEKLDSDVKIIYADPPYTRDHYSRFYHTLETISLRDDPEISKMVLSGESQISRGLYRQERHQSPFCIKSEAPKAFENLITKAHDLGAILIISYSPYSKESNSHPRLLTVESLLTLARRYYKTVYTETPGDFAHSKLNHSSKHLDASKQAEILIICKP